MWYRLAQLAEEDNITPDRQTLDMTGGVKSRKTPPVISTPRPQAELNSVVEPIEIKEETEDEVSRTEDVLKPTQLIDQEDNEYDVFTDYTPPSSSEEEQVEQTQDMYRAEDLSAIMDNAGVQYPVHEACRCRIQFRPDDNASDLLVPRWEVSPGACNHCLDAQRIFNQYVEQTGVRVQPPNNVSV